MNSPALFDSTAVTRAIPPKPPIPVARDDEYVSWGLLSGIVRRRWITIVGALVAAIAIAVLYLLTTPPVYEAGATLLVEHEEYNLPELVKRPFTDAELGTQMEMIKNGALADQVVRALSLRVSVTKPKDIPRSQLLGDIAVADSVTLSEIRLDRTGPTTFRASAEKTGKPLGTVTVGARATLGGVQLTLLPAAAAQRRISIAVATEQAAARNLAESIKVIRPDPTGNVIEVTHRDRDPVLAGRIPDLLATDHVEDRVAAAQAKVQSAVTFLSQQSDSLHRELNDAELSLNAFRRREGIVSLPNEAMSEVTQSGELRASRARLDAERMALQRLVSQADSSAGRTDPSPYRRLTAFPTLINNPVVSNLLTTLNTLENARSDLLLRRTTADPDAIASQKRIAEVDAELRNLTLTYLAGLGNQVAGLDRALAGYSETAARMPGKAMEDDRLSRRPRVLADVYALVQTRLQEARLAEGVVKPGVSIVDHARIPELPVWPRTGVVLAVALAVGLLGGAGMAWIRESMDGAVHSRADVIKAAETRVLGVVPHIRKIQRASTRAGRAPSLWHSPDSLTRADLSAMEAYNWLGTSVSLARPELIGTIAFTSPLAREGKTLSAANFALSGCRRGRRILLIDADLRRGRVHQVFGTPRSPGLAEVLANGLDPSEVILEIPAGAGAVIHIMPAGDAVDHPAALLGSPAMRELLETLRSRYDLVVNDTPPVNLVSDSLLLAQFVDGVILVARAGVTETQSLSEASRHLREAGAPLLGVLLNDIDLHRDGTYDDAYRYLKQAGEYAVASEA